MKNCFCGLVLLSLCLSFSRASAAGALDTTARVFKNDKPVLDTGSFTHWKVVNQGRISPDGRFVSYNVSSIVNQRYQASMMYIVDTALSWSLAVPGVTDETKFSPNSNWAAFINSHDSLGLVNLRSRTVDYLDTVRDWQMIGNGLLYQLKDSTSKLVFRKFDDHHPDTIANIAYYQAQTKPDNAFILTTPDENSVQQILEYDLTTANKHIIWSGKGLKNFAVSRGGRHMAVLTEEQGQGKLWMYEEGRQAATLLKTINPVDIDSLVITGIKSVTDDGNFILVQATEKHLPVKPKLAPNQPDMEIWNWKDVKLQSMKVLEKPQRRDYTFAVNKETGKIVRLEEERERLREIKGNVALVGAWNTDGDPLELNWNKNLQHRFFVKSLQDGHQVALPVANRFASSLSHDGRFVSYYDDSTKHIYSWEIATGTLRDITPPATGRHELRLLSSYDTLPSYMYLEGTVPEENAVLLQDQRDIWLVSLSKSFTPVNLTGGLGMTTNTSFHVIKDGIDTFTPGEAVMVSAFNNTTKENGYFRVKIARTPLAEKLVMGPHLYYAPHTDLDNMGEALRQAEKAGVFLVQRMSAENSPNLFITRDFTSFKAITDVYPERQYNWLTTELLRFQTAKGSYSQGILYKPENFDPSRKYPVIIHYYEQLTDNLHAYCPPRASDGNMNIPWFVSQGYLVFTPDIYYREGEPGPSSLEHINGAADLLSSLPYVDTSKIGLQGHSFGGYETYYAITHTDRYAAACGAAGICNFLSHYSSLMSDGASRASSYEHGQFRMGANLWDKTDQYLDNSPIMAADKVNTPLLILHNEDDKTVPFMEGFQFYTALRRLGKRVWMLDYEGQHHLLSDPDNRMDFTLRLTQFYNHYLKDTPARVWMTRGLPNDFSDSDNGFEVDPEIKTPGPGLLIPEKAGK